MDIGDGRFVGMNIVPDGLEVDEEQVSDNEDFEGEETDASTETSLVLVTKRVRFAF